MYQLFFIWIFCSQLSKLHMYFVFQHMVWGKKNPTKSEVHTINLVSLENLDHTTYYLGKSDLSLSFILYSIEYWIWSTILILVQIISKQWMIDHKRNKNPIIDKIIWQHLAHKSPSLLKSTRTPAHLTQIEWTFFI